MGASTEEETAPPAEGKLTATQAYGLNFMNMVGTGPFITIPLVVGASRATNGYAGLYGYAASGLLCVVDSFIWAELGSTLPQAGGSYVYLRECYGRNSVLGRLMAFLFIWQFIVTGPMEVASGFIAMAQYLAYITSLNDPWSISLLAATFCLTSMVLLYRDTSGIGATTLLLYYGTCLALGVTVLCGFSHFDSSNFESTSYELQSTGFVVSFLAAARFGVYDFAGYYNACYVGDKILQPSRTIPKVVIGSAVSVAVVYGALYLAVLGYLPWFGPDGFGTEGSTSSTYMMSVFYEKMFDHRIASVFTVVVAWTIFGSSFSMMYAYSNIPWAAARDGYFFTFFAHSHPRSPGLADYSLLTLSVVTFACCFIRLDLVIEGMLTTRLIVQFAAQSLGVLLLRAQPAVDEQADELKRNAFKVPCSPISNLFTIVCFTTLFLTTKNHYWNGEAPLLECSIALIIGGLIAFVCWDSVFVSSTASEETTVDSKVVTETTSNVGIEMQQPLIESH